MPVIFQLPSELEKQLRGDVSDLDAQAKEAFLVTLYRQVMLSHYELSEAMGLDRFETEKVLHGHNVTEDLGTAEEYLADLETLNQLREKHKK